MDISNYTTEDFVCDESFRDYCTGSEPDAIQFWTNWIKNHPDKQAVLEEAKALIAILNAKQGNLVEQTDQLRDGVQRYELLRQRLTAQTVTAGATVTEGAAVTEGANVANATTGLREGNTSLFKYATGIAASLLVISITGYLLFFRNKTTPSSDIAASPISFIQSGNEPRKTAMLPDGSVVTLHSNSRLTLASGFNKTNRELILSGEAFFDVSQDALHPFIVHTDHVNIEVLGTLFNVQAYPGDAHTETSLFKGKVAVYVKGHPDQRVILLPSQKSVIANHTEKKVPVTDTVIAVVPLAADPVSHKAKEIAWVRNRIKIVDEPLETIAARLQDWYGISIIFTDNEVKAYRYSGTFESETVVKALDALQLSYPFSFRVENEKIIISK
ncbi:FecR family protein [Flavitalea flava]